MANASVRGRASNWFETVEIAQGPHPSPVDLPPSTGNAAFMAILSAHAQVAGIIGWPVGHSRSPRLHGYWLEKHRIDGAYIPLPIPPEHFRDTVRGLMHAGFAGANVTIPHKLAAFEVCDVVDESARRAGAVNTLTFRDGRITGANTDGGGFLANLRAHGADPKAGPALLLGAGGAARAIAAALLAEGVKVTIANRTPSNAERFVHDLPGPRIVPWERRDDAVPDHALVVNTTALGMNGKEPLRLDLSRAAPGTAVADIVYVPMDTPLLVDARARGLKPVEGLGMLLYQGIPGFHGWFGVEPSVDDDLRRFVAADLMPA
jgi:shikimate dehydrogenase